MYYFVCCLIMKKVVIKNVLVFDINVNIVRGMNFFIISFDLII